MNLQFSGEIWFWRGPAPWHFVTVPDEQCGATTWTTSLWPKDGRYIAPLKTSIRKAERLDIGDTVAVRLTVDL